MNLLSDNQQKSIVIPANSSGGNRRLYAYGAFFTFIYFILLIFYVCYAWERFCNIEPNELGDFLAGGFAPVAFGWLVLGFMQQGIELRQNSEALRLQVEELRTAALHAGSMVELQRADFELRLNELEEARAAAAKAKEDAMEAERAYAQHEERAKAQPLFEFPVGFQLRRNVYIPGMGSGFNGRQWDGELVNNGASCTDVRMSLEVPEGKDFKLFDYTDIPHCASRYGREIHFRSDVLEDDFLGELKINFLDARGQEGFTFFTIRRVGLKVELFKEAALN